ncbi:MAG: DUF3458 domain-containing protein, partial [Pseudomonadales bacterium]|nr:DUF3458 domain-containing protein [Pseudomonadales bacterium]
LLGSELFRKGTDLYFERHDGQAVTTEDFVVAMEEASGIDLGQFRRWYTQAGTPVLTIEGNYDHAQQQFRLRVKQHCPPTPGQTSKQAFHIPLRLGLLGEDGEELSLQLQGEAASTQTDRVIAVTEDEEEFVFVGIPSKPVPSLLRSFSAPVRLNYEYSDEELVFLMVNDSDGFNRWNASQQLAIKVLNALLEHRQAGHPFVLNPLLLSAFEGVLDAALNDASLDKAMLAHLLSLPAESFLIEQSAQADVDGIHEVREFVADSLAGALEEKFSQLYDSNQSDGEFSVSAEHIARRALKNCALSYLMRTQKAQWLQACVDQYQSATNMTDQFSALRCLAHSATEAGTQAGNEALALFYEQWQHEALVVDQWFATQAANPNPNTLEQVKSLMQHEAFSLKNPNKVRSLIGVFCGQNHINFHRLDGSGYEFLADQIIALDKLNPQIAARLITPLTRWKKYDFKRQALMQAQLQRIKSTPELSKDSFEVVEKSTVQLPG